jgi:dihydrofolate reductase
MKALMLIPASRGLKGERVPQRPSDAMTEVIVSEFVSLDGVMEDPSWTFRFGSEEQEKFKFAKLAASDALLLGRVTYQGFAAAWPNMMNQYQGPRRAELGEYADMMNGYPKHVVSTTLEEPLEWNNSTLTQGNVAEEVSRLKRQPGKDILVFGSADLVNKLIRHDLIDEYRLMVFPIVVGSGKRLFWDGSDTKVLRLVETKSCGSGIVALTYQPAGKEDGNAA